MLNKLTLFLLTLLITTNGLAEPFKVGVILPLSGPVAQYGYALKNGFDLFEKHYPDNNLQFQYEDSRYDGATSISAFNKMVGRDKVDIVYVWGTGPSSVLTPIAELKKYPLIIMTGDSSIIRGKEYSIDFSNELSEFSMAELKELRRRGFRKFAIIKSEIQYMQSLVDGMKSNLNGNESLEVIESFQAGQNVNFQSSLTKFKLNLRKGKYDALGVFLVSGQLGSFYKKMYEQNIKVASFGSDFFNSTSERKESGPAMVGAIWSTFGVEEEFSKAYEKRFNRKDQISYAASFYDFSTLLNDLFSTAYQNNKKLSPEKILERIESVKEREGASGKFYFTRDNPDSDPVGGKRFKFPIVIKEVTENGGERVLK